MAARRHPESGRSYRPSRRPTPKTRSACAGARRCSTISTGFTARPGTEATMHAHTRMARVAQRLAPALAAMLLAHSVSAKPGLDTAQIEQLTGAKGQLDEKENVFKV